MRDSFGYDHAVGRGVVASGDGVFAEGLAGGEDGTVVHFLRRVGVGQDPMRQATVFGERESRHEVFTR